MMQSKNKTKNYLSNVIEVIEDTDLFRRTLLGDRNVQAAISQANIDQDWLPVHHQINHVH